MSKLVPVIVLVLIAGCQTAANRPANEQAGRAASPGAPAPGPEQTSAGSTAEGQPAEARRGPRARRGSTPGQFDFYLLTLSWSPEYCATHGTDPECAPRAGGPYGFLVHGLWPQNNDGTFPENCSSAPGPADPGVYRDIIPDASLLKHEWQTHGTCTGLAPDVYFGMARTAFHDVTVPAAFTGTSEPAMLAPAAILGEFAGVNPGFPKGSLALSCGNNRLTAVEVCFSKELKPIACSGVKTCRAYAVKITPR